MNAIHNQAYFEGMFKAAFGTSLLGGTVAEWQIDEIKEYVSRARTSEIDHSSLPLLEKEERKRQLKQWVDSFTQGLKDRLKMDGRLV